MRGGRVTTSVHLLFQSGNNTQRKIVKCSDFNYMSGLHLILVHEFNAKRHIQLGFLLSWCVDVDKLINSGWLNQFNANVIININLMFLLWHRRLKGNFDLNTSFILQTEKVCVRFKHTDDRKTWTHVKEIDLCVIKMLDGRVVGKLFFQWRKEKG